MSAHTDSVTAVGPCCVWSWGKYIYPVYAFSITDPVKPKLVPFVLNHTSQRSQNYRNEMHMNKRIHDIHHKIL